MTPQLRTDAADHTRLSGPLLAATIAACSVVCYLAYAWAAIVRLDLVDDTAPLVFAITLLAALFAFGIVRPLATAMLVLVAIPLFGNHPGGRLMEIINLPLAASAAGLALEARLHGRPRPAGPLWVAAWLYLASAIVAIVPSIPGMMVRAAQLNHWPMTLVEALTAPEDNPLYSLSSLVGVTLCVMWAAALAWRSPDPPFFRTAIRSLVYVFVIVVGLGVLDQFGVIQLVPSYLLRIDPRRPDVSGFQSIFWNPGWFAWYFVMVFGLGIGLLWSVRLRERYVLGTLLAVCYVFSFFNPQRGGLVALHVSLALAAWIVVRLSGTRVARRAVPVAAAALALTIVGAYTFELIPRSLGSSLFRLIENPDEAVTSTSVRFKLWTVALQMWRDAPVFGLGEGSFGWRFEDYAPRGSALFTDVHGDAHSTWMQILATRGLFGVLSFVALLWTIGRSLRAAAVRQLLDRGVVIGLALSLAAFLVYTTVQGMFYLQSIQALFWFIVATTATSRVAQPVAIPRWRSAVVAAAVALVFVAQAITTRPLYARARDVIARQPKGFYRVEGDDSGRWRWSTGPEGTLCLQPLGPRLQLRVTTDDPRPEEYPRLVTVRVNDAVVDTFAVAGPDAVARTIAMPWWSPRAVQPAAFGECGGRPDEVRLTVGVDRTWSPLAEGLGDDPRTFGVRVFEPSYVAPEDLLPPPPPGRQ